MEFGLKDKGVLGIIEDSFSLGNTNGWSVTPNTNITWSVVDNALRATVNAGTGGYSYITYNAVALSNTNVTVCVDLAFGNGAKDGGIIYRGRVLHINANRIGWEDNSPTYFNSTNVYTDGRTNRVVLTIRDGVPYRRTDLFINNYFMFRDEPLQSTNWTTNTVGILSPYSNATSYLQVDNFRLVDEQYATVWTNATGVSYPTNAIPTATWPSVPDYDPGMLEHNGTSGGSKYEWHISFRGAGHNAQLGVEMWISPRLIVEDTNFPKVLNPGATYAVPIEWEELKTNLPIFLEVRLEEPYVGTNYASTLFTLDQPNGSSNFLVTLPLGIPASTNYLWLAYLYPTYATNPMLQRLGLDDTFRFTPEPFGVPTIPETSITVTPLVGSNYMVYSDAGVDQNGGHIFTWYPYWEGDTATFDGQYTNVAGIPEGTKCFYTWGTDWSGWGVFMTNGTLNMANYKTGSISLSVKSSQALTMEIQDVNTNKGWYYIPSTTNNWLTMKVPFSNFANLAAVNFTNMSGLFMITSTGATTNYVDNVYWRLTP
jgi:hypothetical protein